jgi:hypothetical protein
MTFARSNKRRPQGKAAVALRRLKIAFKSEHLPCSVKAGFPMDELDFEVWRDRFEAAANKKLGRPDRTDFGKRRAAEAAARLLQTHNLPVKASRRGKFCRLAALIYGDEKADLFRQCRAYKQMTRSGPEIVPLRISPQWQS